MCRLECVLLLFQGLEGDVVEEQAVDDVVVMQSGGLAVHERGARR